MKFVAIDFETANRERSSICEVGLTVVENGRITDAISYLVKPRNNCFDPFNTALHGISSSTVKNEPEFDQIWQHIHPLIESNNLIAHNAGFDISALRHVLDLYNIAYPNFNYSCSYQISKRAWKGLLSYRLDSICKHMQIPLQHHRALADSTASAQIAIRAFEDNEVASFDDIERKFNLKIGKLFPGGYAPALTKHAYKGKSYKIGEIQFDHEKADPENIFYGKNVVFTGSLASLVRKDAQKMVLEIGGHCTTTVANNTDFLIVGEQDFTQYGEGFKSSKMKKAEALLAKGLEIELITEAQFLQSF